MGSSSTRTAEIKFVQLLKSSGINHPVKAVPDQPVGQSSGHVQVRGSIQKLVDILNISQNLYDRLAENIQADTRMASNPLQGTLPPIRLIQVLFTPILSFEL